MQIQDPNPHNNVCGSISQLKFIVEIISQDQEVRLCLREPAPLEGPHTLALQLTTCIKVTLEWPQATRIPRIHHPTEDTLPMESLDMQVPLVILKCKDHIV